MLTMFFTTLPLPALMVEPSRSLFLTGGCQVSCICRMPAPRSTASAARTSPSSRLAGSHTVKEMTVSPPPGVTGDLNSVVSSASL